MTYINIGLDEMTFSKRLAKEIVSGGLSIVDSIEKLLEEHFDQAVTSTLNGRLIKAPRTTVHSLYAKNRYDNLSGLSQTGYKTWYPEIRFSTGLDDKEDYAVTVKEKSGLSYSFLTYGWGIKRAYVYKKKVLKTQTNHTLRVNEVDINGPVFSKTIDEVMALGVPKNPYIANLELEPQIDGFRIVSFDHMLTGERQFCSCHYDCHQTMLAEARSICATYVPGSWPHQVIGILKNASYQDDLCHFCVAKEFGKTVEAEWYGNQIQKAYGPYVDFLIHDEQLDTRTAKAEAKHRLSLSRWLHEAELCELVKRIFPSQRIQREASPDWLGRQRLDIYLPELNLALEYQGEQHYRPVDIFGGEEALKATILRDERKRKVCQENGVDVVDVRFDEKLSLANIRRKLRKWIV